VAVDIAGFVSRNFRGPDLAQIDRSRYTNALLKNTADQIPMQNALMKQDYEIAGAQNQRAQAQEGRQQEAFSSAQQDQKTQWFVGASEYALKNPGAWPTLIDEGKKRGLIPQEFNQPYDAAKLQQFVDQARVQGAGAPQAQTSELQTFGGMTRGMSPEDVDQARRIQLGLSSRAGQTRIMDVNGVPTLTGVSENGQPFQVPLSSLQQTAGAAGTIAQATRAGTEAAVTQAIPGQVEAKGTAERRVELQNTAPVAFKAAEYAVGQIDRFTEQAKILRDHPGLKSATGFGGAQLSGIPGTPAADAASLLETLKSQAFISALGAMREASKTGGAVGNVSDAEGGRFENAFVALKQAQSYPQFIRELDRLIEINEESKRRIGSAYSMEYRDVQGAPKFGQGGGTQGGPTRVQSDDEYNSLPSGAQYIAPDGSTRTKR
jgi:hypothetical protein